MRKLIVFIFLFTYSFAITPFSLEGLKEVNLKILNKKKNISEKLEYEMKSKIKDELKKLGIKSETKNFSNFLVKIQIDKIGDIDFVRTSIILSEDVKLFRETNFEAIAITYRKDDSFEAENLEKDIYESVVDYLLADFIEQYKEEN